MEKLTIDMVYGKALFQAARDMGNPEELLAEAKQLEAIFSEEPAFFAFVCSPIISAKEKKAAIHKIFDDRLSQALVNFLLVLIDKGRGSHFPKIIHQYEVQLAESQGHSRGILYSVQPLKPDQLNAFEEQTGRLLGKQVKLENRIDASLIGGVRIFVEGKLLDASIKTKLETLMESLKTS